MSFDIHVLTMLHYRATMTTFDLDNSVTSLRHYRDLRAFSFFFCKNFSLQILKASFCIVTPKLQMAVLVTMSMRGRMCVCVWGERQGSQTCVPRSPLTTVGQGTCRSGSKQP